MIFIWDRYDKRIIWLIQYAKYITRLVNVRYLVISIALWYCLDMLLQYNFKDISFQSNSEMYLLAWRISDPDCINFPSIMFNSSLLFWSEYHWVLKEDTEVRFAIGKYT